jgi:hypothetical protein
MKITSLIVCLLCTALLAGAQKPVPKAALDSIHADSLVAAVKILGSDEYEGRGVATAGEAKTIAFLQAAFKGVGAEPGNGTSFLQDVPMVRIANDHLGLLAITAAAAPTALRYGSDYIGYTRRCQADVAASDSPLVFVGFGIVAPEYQWDDYRGLDVRGKTVVMLVNDPGYYNPALFRGKDMTWYGRWVYKFAEAGRHGAAAALLIHATGPASYGWEVVLNSYSGARCQLDSGSDEGKCGLDAWISQECATALATAAGTSLDAWLKAALTPGFAPQPLSLKAAFSLHNTVEKIVSHNVIAKIPGTDLANECIIYTAHWDHFGRDPNLAGDQIYNGALDNATGSAALVELARAFKHAGRLRRSVLFISVTAEEQGLLGSEYYVNHPLIPLAKTAADINLDSLNIFGRMRDLMQSGFGWSELDEYLKAAAAEQDRVVVGDAHPETGGFFRSDHFSFVKLGVPAVNATSGEQHREKGAEWGRQTKTAYFSQHYHQPSDEYRDSWDMSGAIEDLRLVFAVGWRLSMESTFPKWRPASPYQRPAAKK